MKKIYYYIIIYNFRKFYKIRLIKFRKYLKKKIKSFISFFFLNFDEKYFKQKDSLSKPLTCIFLQTKEMFSLEKLEKIIINHINEVGQLMSYK